jgi:myo-inositol catabolism protein IolC
MSGREPDDHLIVAAVDHRFDFVADLVGDRATEPSAASLEQAAELKGIVLAAIATAIEDGLPKSNLAVWSETTLGEASLLRARGMSVTTIASVERPGPQHFRFHSALEFTESLHRIGATYAGARINHNIEGDLAESEAHLRSLRRLSEISRTEGPPLILELCIPPTRSQMKNLSGVEEWMNDFRPAVLLETLRTLQDSGVEPAIWAFAPPLDPIAASAVTAQAYTDDRVDTRVLFTVGTDPDQDEAGMERVIGLAARTDGVSGLVLGPAIYASSLAPYIAGETTRDEAISAICERVGAIASQYAEAGTALDVT